MIPVTFVVSIRDMADQAAEQIATLGGVPNGLPGHLVENRSWEDYGVGRDVVVAHLSALDRVYDGLISDHRGAITNSSQQTRSQSTSSPSRRAPLALYQWSVRAHLEDNL